MSEAADQHPLNGKGSETLRTLLSVVATALLTLIVALVWSVREDVKDIERKLDAAISVQSVHAAEPLHEGGKAVVDQILNRVRSLEETLRKGHTH